MSTPTLDRPAAGYDEHGRTTDRGQTASALALLLALAAMLGGGATVAVLFAVGALHGGASGTGAVDKAPAATGSGSTPGSGSSGLDAKAVYAAADAGVVDISATSAGSGGSSGTATGAGSVIDSGGEILTASHVVDGASSITVTFQNGTTRNAQLLGEDRSTDAAVLKVNPAGLTLHALALGSSASLSTGDPLAVIGDPFDYSRSLSTGVVSGLDRTIQAPNGFTVAHAIQTDAALNPGNSGGPVLNASERLVGIADQIAIGGSSGSSSYTGVGFAVPIDVVKAELSALEHGQSVAHPYLGVSTSESTSSAGALVDSVAAGSPAANAGLRGGDVIFAINGSTVHGSNDLVSAIAARHPGDRISLTVLRGSSRVTVTATLASQPQTAAG